MCIICSFNGIIILSNRREVFIMEKKYKLYKSGKMWVVGAVAVAGVAISATTQVSADTVSSSDTQAVSNSDTAKDDNTVQLPSSSGVSKDNATNEVTADTSTVPTSVKSNTTQDEAKKAVDSAQDTVKKSADTATKTGVDVSTGKTTDVTIDDNNAKDKTDKVLSDLNKQDQTLKDATAKQQENQKAYESATDSQKTATTQGNADLKESTDNLDKSVDNAKQAGIDVSVQVSKTSPEYKSLKGLSGKDLLSAMNYNIDLYKKAIANGVASQNADSKKLIALSEEYQKQVSEYEAKKAAIDKSNAEKKAAFDKALSDYLNGTNVEKSLIAKTQTDQDTGTLKTFMESEVNQATGEFTLSHDMNSIGTVIGRGYLKGKIIYDVTSNGDGSETVHVKGITLYSYSYTKFSNRTSPNPNINFHVYDFNGNELYSKYHDGNASFDETINKTFALDKTFVLLPNQSSDSFEFLRVDDNWDVNTHGQVFVQFKNTNTAPKTPNYDPEPTAPEKLTATVTKVEVVDLPQAEKPENQKVSVHYYNIKKTPKVETPKVVATSSVMDLPKTHAENNSATNVFMWVASSLASLGLLVGISKKGQKQKK